MGNNDLSYTTFDRILKKYGNDVQLNQLPLALQPVLAVINSGGLLGNGGFDYLLSGDFPGDPGFALTRQAFRTIGAERAVAVFDKAFSVFPNSIPPINIDERLRMWRAKYSLRKAVYDDNAPDSMIIPALKDAHDKLNRYIRDNEAAFADLGD